MRDEPLDVPGMVRRVRRECDLSQRELAAELGVSQSMVARWEVGAAEPSLSLFHALVALAGWAVAVIDEDAEPVIGMEPDGCRDRGHRRFPAHLDVADVRDPITWEFRPSAARRHWRDRARALVEGVAPADHPTWATLWIQREEERQRKRAAALARAQGRTRRQPLPPCACPGECFLLPGCARGCRCGCEERTR